jgi:hypothetical protein
MHFSKAHTFPSYESILLELSLGIASSFLVTPTNSKAKSQLFGAIFDAM